MNYMIHTCPKRKWYVDQFLIPSMLEQGIKISDIVIFNDTANAGCLRSYIGSFNHLNGDGTWHLQDDIIISKRFKELTEYYDNGIVCGFCNTYDLDKIYGYVEPQYMWYSFPCIRIPNEVSRAFINWYYSERTQREYFTTIWQNKGIDYLFRNYVLIYYTDLILNLKPNIVNHVDHLIGGSIINADRFEDSRQIMAVYWDEYRLLRELEEKLK